MSRYIDTEWLENNAKEYSLGYYEADEWATPLSILDSAPSIDIVFCEDCLKHKVVSFGENACFYWCELRGHAINPYDFCSRGERKEGE